MAATRMSRFERLPGQVGRARVADRHGRVRLEQELRDRLADDVRPADDHRVLPGRVDPVFLQQPHDPERGRTDEVRPSEREQPGADRMEAVDVLGRVDRLDGRRLVQVRRQRRLDEEAVDCVVGVQLRDDGQQLLLCDLSRQPLVERLDAGLAGGLLLERDVDVRGGIVADQHRRQTDAAEVLDAGRNLLAHARGERLPVHDGGGHYLGI